MTRPITLRLQAEQLSDGLFRSQVERGGVRHDDANLFVTALVLREMRHCDVGGGWRAVALDALAREAQLRPDGACGFWPGALRPAWAARVPTDVDDTALVLAELFRHGRISRAIALRRAVLALLPCRTARQDRGTAPNWIVAGCFRTWIDQAGSTRANPVDCCVNANVAALFALLGAKHLPGFAQAIATIEAGLAWAGSDARRLDALTPFYPAPRLLLAALDHAVECGAAELGQAASQLRSLAPAILAGAPGLCRDAWGKCTWHAPVLSLISAAPAPLAA